MWTCPKCQVGWYIGKPDSSMKCPMCDDPNYGMELIQDTTNISETDYNCTCDFVAQLLPYGCKCGGK